MSITAKVIAAVVERLRDTGWYRGGDPLPHEWTEGSNSVELSADYANGLGPEFADIRLEFRKWGKEVGKKAFVSCRDSTAVPTICRMIRRHMFDRS